MIVGDHWGVRMLVELSDRRGLGRRRKSRPLVGAILAVLAMLYYKYLAISTGNPVRANAACAGVGNEKLDALLLLGGKCAIHIVLHCIAIVLSWICWRRWGSRLGSYVCMYSTAK